MLRILALSALLCSIAWASEPAPQSCAVDLAEPGLSLLALSGSSMDGRLDPTTVATLTEVLGVTKASPQLKYFEQMEGIVKELVDDGKITSAEAENLFSEKILGEFSGIFLKFVVAELAERHFEQNDVSNFVIHFDSVFRPDRQVEFAAAVARRMLVTLNTDAGISSPEGMREFLATAKVFKVSTETYSEFLQVWAYVSRSRPATILRFILANIKNTGKYVNQREIDRQSAAPPPIPVRKPNWFEKLMYDEPRVLSAQGDDILSVDEIPSFIRDLTFLEPPKKTANFLQLAYGVGGAYPGDLLRTRRPQVVVDHLVSMHVNLFSLPKLEELTARDDYANLDDSVRSQVEERLGQFRSFRLAAKSLEEEIVRIKENRAARRRARKRPAVTEMETELAKKFYREQLNHFRHDFGSQEINDFLWKWRQSGADIRNVLFIVADQVVEYENKEVRDATTVLGKINLIRSLFQKSDREWEPEDLSRLLKQFGAIKVTWNGSTAKVYLDQLPNSSTWYAVNWNNHQESTFELAADNDAASVLKDHDVERSIKAVHKLLSDTYHQNVDEKALLEFYSNYPNLPEAERWAPMPPIVLGRPSAQAGRPAKM